LLPHLKTAEQFAAVLDASRQSKAGGAGMWRSAHFVLHVAPWAALPAFAQNFQSQGIKPVQAMLGVICPKRWAKRAVTRNAIRRQFYAACAVDAAQLPAACMVLRLSRAFSRETFPSASSVALKKVVREEIQGLLSKLAVPVAQEMI